MSDTDSPAAPKTAADESTPRSWGSILTQGVISIAILVVLLGVIFFGGPYIWGLYEDFFGDSPVATAAPTCTPPEGTKSTVDGLGRVLWDSVLEGADGTATLILCEGDIARPLRVRGLVQGEVVDNQADFATDGDGKVVTAERVMTTSPTFVWVPGLLLEAQCLDMAWKGACDPA